MARSNAWHRQYYRKRRQQAIEKLGGVCVACGVDEGLEFDHIVPLGGGAPRLRPTDAEFVNELPLLQLLCRPCHVAKSTAEGSLDSGVRVFGSANGNAVLTAELVEQIRAEYTGAWGEQSQLGRKYGVSRKTIAQVVNRETWC